MVWGRDGQEVDDRQGGPDAEVHGTRLQSLQDLWSVARLHAEVRHLPDLLPRVGLDRAFAGCDEGEFLGFAGWACPLSGLPGGCTQWSNLLACGGRDHQLG